MKNKNNAKYTPKLSQDGWLGHGQNFVDTASQAAHMDLGARNILQPLCLCWNFFNQSSFVGIELHQDQLSKPELWLEYVIRHFFSCTLHLLIQMGIFLSFGLHWGLLKNGGGLLGNDVFGALSTERRAPAKRVQFPVASWRCFEFVFLQLQIEGTKKKQKKFWLN